MLEWDFGDGTIVKSTAKFANHFYQLPGLYYVRLTVRKGSSGNYKIQPVSIKKKVPPTSPPAYTWAEPSLIINGALLDIRNGANPNRPLELRQFVIVKASASAATGSAGGIEPYQEYHWTLTNNEAEKSFPALFGNNIRVNASKVTTTPEATIEAALFGSRYPTSLKLYCKVKDANGVFSKEAIMLVDIKTNEDN